MQESHLANCIGGFSEPKKGEKLSEMAAEAQIPPGSALPEHSPGLMRCETPAVFLERGRCLRCGTFAGCHPRRPPAFCRLLARSLGLFPPQSRQGDLILAADWDPCLKVDRG